LHKFKILVLIFFTITIFTFSDNITINSGHSHPIQSITSNDKQLFSCDTSGTLLVWDIGKKELIKKLQISYLQVKNITVNSNGTKVAIVETDTISSFKLSVWDIEKEEKLFSHKMTGLPLFIKFSPKDSFIIYSKTDRNSLVFLDAEQGYEVPVMFEDYGLVSSIYITGSEKTLMFYSPSGTIQYWNLLNGKIKTSPIRTRKDLSFINITADGAYMTASDSNNLYLINMQSGKTFSSTKISGIISSSSIDAKKELAVLQKISNKFILSIWKINTIQGRESLNKIETIELSSNILPVEELTLIDNIVYLAGSNGEIISTNIITDKSNIFSKNIMANITDISILDGEILIATTKNIINMKANFLNNSSKSINNINFSLNITTNPFKEETGIVNDKFNFYIYPKVNRKGELLKFSNGDFVTLSTNFSSPIISAKYIDEYFLTLEKDGSCQNINSITGNTFFEYTSFGINSLESVFGGNLIAGRNRTAFLKSPLLHINTATEEVVPIKESNIIIFKMDYDSITRTLYTLGFEERNSGLITVLKAHTGRAWELTDTIMTYPGEDQAGSFVVDESKSRIYLSIGNSGLIMYGWNGFTDMEQTNHIPKNLYVSENLLVSLNTDSSLSFWDTTNGELIVNFFLLKSGEWIAVTRDKQTILSNSSLKKLIN